MSEVVTCMTLSALFRCRLGHLPFCRPFCFWHKRKAAIALCSCQFRLSQKGFAWKCVFLPVLVPLVPFCQQKLRKRTPGYDALCTPFRTADLIAIHFCNSVGQTCFVFRVLILHIFHEFLNIYNNCIHILIFTHIFNILCIFCILNFPFCMDRCSHTDCNGLTIYRLHCLWVGRISWGCGIHKSSGSA